MFGSVKDYFSRKDQHHNDRKSLELEAKEFRIPSETMPQILKYIFFAGLAFLNYRLFSTTVPGLWGHATGVVAVMGEAIAVYCTHNFSRSSGAFRIALGLFGTSLLLFAIAHSTFSFLDLVNVADISGIVHGYARVVAFPLLASLLGLAVVAITMTHPKNLIRLKQAKAHTDVAIGRAESASELALMRAQSIVERAHLEKQQERTKLQEEYLNELAKVIAAEEKKIAMIAAIRNPALRAEVARENGIDLNALNNQTATSQPQAKPVPAKPVPVQLPAPKQKSGWI